MLSIEGFDLCVDSDFLFLLLHNTWACESEALGNVNGIKVEVNVKLIKIFAVLNFGIERSIQGTGILKNQSRHDRKLTARRCSLRRLNRLKIKSIDEPTVH